MFEEVSSVTPQQRQARRVIAAAAVARRLTERDEALRSHDVAQTTRYVGELLAASSRATRVGRAYGERYGVATLAEVAFHAGISV